MKPAFTLLLVACLPLLHAEAARSQDASPLNLPRGSVNTEAMAAWLKGLYSEAEFRALRPDEIALTSHQCGCYDRPNPHYPYALVVLATPRGELILRPEQRELQVSFVKLAVRRGELYCDPEPASECYGQFADVCEFTDFRFGAQLAPYFPNCKSAD